MIETKTELKKLLKEAIGKSKLISGRFEVEEPKNPEFGDLATNAPIVLAAKNKLSPAEIAEKISKNIVENKIVGKPEFKNGFLNFQYRKQLITDALDDIIINKQPYGSDQSGKGKKVLVEFVSANPTGELHIGNARGGPIGETIANLYTNYGYDVDREYYVNDFGVQVDKLAKTLLFYLKKLENSKLFMTEDMYPGEYIEQVFKEIFKSNQKQLAEMTEDEQVSFFTKEGLRILLKKICDQLEYLGIKYDNFIYESDILCSGKSDRVVNLMEEKGFVSNKEGALWFRNPEDPQMLDRETVLRKSDGEKSFTYFTNDIAYHLDKFERGYKQAVDVWGANHFGHIPRLQSAMRALGLPEDFLSIILYQNVRLKEGNEISQMSKRKGNTITIDDLKKSGISADVFKFMILAHDSNSLIDFDVKLAKDSSEKNPVFYVKYAHARICSILRKAGILGDIKGELGEIKRFEGKINVQEKEELSLAKELVKYPEILGESFSDFQLQRLPHYAVDLATEFHNFYTKCHVIGEKKEIEQSRLGLILATKIVLKNLLSIMGIDAPEKM